MSSRASPRGGGDGGARRHSNVGALSVSGVCVRGVGSDYPRPSDDGSQVSYPWLPHSTALGPSSAVAVRIRNASLITTGMTGVGGGRHYYCENNNNNNNNLIIAPVVPPPTLEDEKKYGEGDGDGEGESSRHSINNSLLPECRAEASIHCHGLPLQAAAVSTRYSPLVPDDDDDNNGNNAAMMIYSNRSRRQPERARATFDSILSLPVRWRDLTRDACLAINVFCEGGDFDFGGGGGNVTCVTDNGGHSHRVDILGSVNNDENGGGMNDTAKDTPSIMVWGTTLPLFDRNGCLRTGLHKLKLHPRLMADGGMGYASMGVIGGEGGEMPIETFLDGGATPGVVASNEGIWGEGDHEEDPKWKASLILHELDHRPGGGSVPSGTAAAVGAPPGGVRTTTLPKTQQQTTATSNNPWLDALTRRRCLDILSERDEGDGGYRHEGDPSSSPPDRPGNNDGGVPPPAPTSSRRDYPYLIIELPTPPIPILHEEPVYPVETSTSSSLSSSSAHNNYNPRGTTGSITANELIKFHSKLRSAAAAAEGGERDSSDCGLTVRVHPSAAEIPTAPQNGNDPHSFLYPLVQTLDHDPPLAEAGDDGDIPRDNPAQDKYRILAHDLIRGLVDPGLKPDRSQRARLGRIVSSPSHHLSTEEKDLLWRFRFSLVDERRALTKFLLAVDWTVESEVVQAAELLEQWRKRSPIEVTDALKLLGRNVAFQTSLVRSYAIETLSEAPDEELRLYFLQLVQALKYEEDISGGVSGGSGGEAVANAFSRLDDNNGGSGGGNNKPTRISSLSAFLIERASHNIELSNYLYWYLKVEMLESNNYEARYREVFLAFQAKLSSVRVSNGSIIPPAGSPPPESSTITLWQLFMYQEKFISGILDCQRDSLLVRGKKDAKETHLREALEAGGFHDIPHAVPLPSAPHIWVRGVNCNSAKMFKSALYPAVLDFIVDGSLNKSEKGGNGGGSARAGSSSKPSKKQPRKDGGKAMYKVMIKTGDDLRQDQLVIMMIQLMDRLLKRGTLDLCLRPYSILAMPNNTGLLEFVERSIPVSAILSGYNNSIMAFFQSVAPQEGARHSVKPDVLQTYIRSCAGYCVLTYLLGVGDRHLDNIMIQPTGHFFHIDFGFIFGRDPKPLPPAFRLTKEMVDGMGGTDSKEYRQFCSLACQAFNVLRKSAGLVLNLLHLMSDAGIEDLSHNPSADAIGVISKVEERFKLELTDEQAEQFFVGLINESLAALAPRVMEMFHQLSVARR